MKKLATEADAAELMRRLADVRKKQNLTQEKVAVRMGMPHHGPISAWETGQRVPLLHNVIGYTRAVGARLSVEIVVPLHEPAHLPPTDDVPLPIRSEEGP